MINTTPAVAVRAGLNALGVVRSLARGAVPTIVMDTTRRPGHMVAILPDDGRGQFRWMKSKAMRNFMNSPSNSVCFLPPRTLAILAISGAIVNLAKPPNCL